jgi:hypothetical protein
MDLNPGGSQVCNASSAFSWVFDGDKHSRDPCGDQGVRARRGAPGVGARLKSYVDVTPLSSRASFGEGVDFSMCPAGEFV